MKLTIFFKIWSAPSVEFWTITQGLHITFRLFMGDLYHFEIIPTYEIGTSDCQKGDPKMGHDCDHYQSHEHLENVLEETFRHIFQVFLWLVMVTVMTHHMRASLLRTSIMPIFKSLSKKSFDNSVYFVMTISIPTTLITILTWELENLNSWQSFWPDN